jgi:hypothetical protein
MSSTSRERNAVSGVTSVVLRLTVVMTVVFGVYVALFSTCVKRGHAMYALDDGQVTRGSVTYYWFSRRQPVNEVCQSIYTPVLNWYLGCRPYSSFSSPEEYIAWCESGHDVFMDDVSQIE